MRWKNALNIDYKNNNGRKFQFTKFSLIDFVLTDRRNLSGKRQKLASGRSSSCWLSFSAERNGNTKATKCVTFSFFSVYWFPTPSKKVWTLQSVSDTHILVFYRHNSRKLRQKNLYWESRRLCRSFINLIEWRQWQVRLIGYINTRERIRYFFTCVVTAFLRAANPCVTPQFMWWKMFVHSSCAIKSLKNINRR